MIVQKYGGSSISKKGFDLIKEQIKKHKKLIIVLSALTGTTSQLIKFTETHQIKIIEQVRSGALGISRGSESLEIKK